MSDSGFTCACNRQLPPALRPLAAWHAAIMRPENGPGLIDWAYGQPAAVPPSPQSIALLKSKAWPNGSQLKVAFKGGNRATNTRVLEFANHWSQWANIGFVDVGSADAWDILVGYDQPGFWSYIGTDSRFVRQATLSDEALDSPLGRWFNEHFGDHLARARDLLAARGLSQTLNLEGFDSGRMPESEWYRVAEHEIGHALLAMHEQMRPEIVARLDRPACYAYFMRTQGWSREDIDQQLFATLDMTQVIASPFAEETSVMMYSFEPPLTLDRKGIRGGDRITELDGTTMAKVYPGRAVPAPHFRKAIEVL